MTKGLGVKKEKKQQTPPPSKQQDQDPGRSTPKVLRSPQRNYQQPVVKSARLQAGQGGKPPEAEQTETAPAGQGRGGSDLAELLKDFKSLMRLAFLLKRISAETSSLMKTLSDCTWTSSLNGKGTGGEYCRNKQNKQRKVLRVKETDRDQTRWTSENCGI